MEMCCLNSSNQLLLGKIPGICPRSKSRGANVPIHVDVQSLVVNGETWDLGGYLDIGIVDTMKDLIVNFIGAVVFSIIGILYLRNRGKGKLAASLIPQVRSKQEENHSSKDQ